MEGYKLTLLDGTQFLLEIDVERGSCHLFLNVRYEKRYGRRRIFELTNVTS
jgi:hypothetical protein